MKKFARDFINNLKDKISKFESGHHIEYKSTDIDLKGQDTNEKFSRILKFKGFNKLS